MENFCDNCNKLPIQDDPHCTSSFQSNLSSGTITNYRVDVYDEMCEEFSKIEKIICLAYDRYKIAALLVLNVLTGFIFSLVLVWYPGLKMWFVYSPVPLMKAKCVGIYGTDGKFYITELMDYYLSSLADSHLRIHCQCNIESTHIKVFQFKLFNYLYDVNTCNFQAIRFDIKTTQEAIHNYFTNGLNPEEVHRQKCIFGECNLNVQIDSFFKLLLIEFSDPFYIFQVFSCALWILNNYTAYATVIIVSSVISLLISVLESRENLLSIQHLAKYSCPVVVYRIIKRIGDENENEKITLQMSSTELVPGDIFEIPEEGFAMPCDAILINGTVIVNESMLTGESTPIMKSHIANINTIFDAKFEKKSMLYAGTKIIQKRCHAGGKVLGLAYSTGFNTVKGNLIRAILFPKESDFKFKKDSVTYIKIMALLSFIGFSISIPYLIRHGINPIEIFFRSVDLVTVTVPPALPACIGIGISYGLSRLKNAGILCISRERLNVSGKVNIICFDKTGTLTEDHLDILGFRPVRLSKEQFIFDYFTPNCVEYPEAKIRNFSNSDNNKDLRTLFVECLATCHGITTVNGKIIGDHIDVKMFEASGWTLQENLDEDTNQNNYDPLISTYVLPPNESDDDKNSIMRNHYKLGIVRRFDFSSKLQRMSVLVKNANEPHFKAFCKGSPEKLKELCRPETLPENFNDVLDHYTYKGYRVLAMAFKLIKMDYMNSQKVTREIIESNMIFLGLIVVQNKLKQNTSSSIDTLHNAHLKMVMATGDNILTAISVAKECRLIKRDAVVYTCDVSKEKKEHYLVWNMADRIHDDKDALENSSQDITNIQSEEESDDAASLNHIRHFVPEQVMNINDIINEKLNDIMDICEYNSANDLTGYEELNVDLEKYPFRDIFEDDKVIAITGETFETIWKLRNRYQITGNEKYKSHYDAFRLILENCIIFARMSPEQKTILVECLREEKLTVCMCGDGANDCGALRAADVGVSLSPDEASIAAHFSSNVADISCLIKLFREGKASLVCSIQTFKYMMVYSLIQFTTVTMLMLVNSYLTDYQFLASDLFIIFPLAMLIARTGAYEKLTHHRPIGALISVPIVSSILIQAFLCFGFQMLGWKLLYNQAWYKHTCYTEGSYVAGCYDQSTIFLISNMQYLITAAAFSIAKPFRKSIYSNNLLCAFIILAFSFSVYIILSPDYHSAKLLKIVSFEEEKFKYDILLLTIVNFVFSYIVEKFFIPIMTRQWKTYKYHQRRQQINTHSHSFSLNQLHKIKLINKFS